MYEETRNSIDWKGLFLKVIIAFLIVFIAVLIEGYVNYQPKVNERKKINKEAKTYTNTEIEKWVGDTAVSVQIKDAIADIDYLGAAAGALTSAKSYTDEKISDLINSAPSTLDTLGEIAKAMSENESVVDTLESAVGSKANAADLTSHITNKSNPHNVTLDQLGVSATVTELNYVDGVTSNIQDQIDNKVPVTRTINGKPLSADITLTAGDLGIDVGDATDTVLTVAKSYTDSEITEWVGDKTVAEQIRVAIDSIDVFEFQHAYEC